MPPLKHSTAPEIGPTWVYVTIVLLLAAPLAWVIFWPSVPDCASPVIRQTVEELFRGRLMQLAALQGDKPAPKPTVEGFSELGYASAEGVRACKATVKLDGAEMPYAFTITRSTGKKRGHVVTGAQLAILQTRFGNIDADGDFGNKAEPLGRAEVERAFRAGVETARQRFAGIALYPPERPEPDVANAARRKFGLPYESAERTREIAEVEPLAPCRAVQGDKVYSCRLLVERNDPLGASLGRTASIVLDAEFTFERGGAAGEWRTTAAFSDEYANAIVAAWKKGGMFSKVPR